jgi:NAD+ synthase
VLLNPINKFNLAFIIFTITIPNFTNNTILIMQHKKVIQHIVNWLTNYSNTSHTNGFVVGISGGIDSAVTSTLCALTGKKVLLLNMPIKQIKTEFDRGNEHISWLKNNFKTIEAETIDLTQSFESIEKTFPKQVANDFLSMANTRARLRMLTLYACATSNKLLVAGTGNKVEDFGVGFYTKYGDGGVDISPIADLYKTQVYALAKELNLVQSIQLAKPTDGLFADGRTDEDQIGATYPELEWAMEYLENNRNEALSEREKIVMQIYTQRHGANKHKMEAIPVCLIPKELKY